MATDVGDIYPITVETRDAAGVLANAGAVALTITLPDGTPTSPSMTNTGTGVYSYDYPTAQAGRHTVRVVATGANSSAWQDVFTVQPTDSGALISLAEAKKQLNIATSTADDEEIRDWIPVATPIIQRHTGKTLIRATKVWRRRDTHWTDTLYVYRPLISLTSIASYDGSVTYPVGASDVDVDTDTGCLTSLTSGWRGRLKVTVVAGAAVVPANYAAAARIIVQHLWTTQRGTKGGPRVGGMQDSMGVNMAGFAIPNAALELLGPPGLMVA